MALSFCPTVTDVHQKELAERGSLAFPIACYADDLSQMTVPWHWHEELEFVVVASGVPLFRLENAVFTLSPGEGILINAGALHTIEDDGNGVILHSGVFHPRLIGSPDSLFWQQSVAPLLADFGRRFWVFRPTEAWQNRVLTSFLSCWQSMADEPDGYENRVRFELTDALTVLRQHHLSSAHPFSEQEQIQAERIRMMLEYIEQHFAEAISLTEIAGSIAVSPSVCLRCFEKTLGTTPIQYVKQFRLEKAATMLRTTQLSAKEIAFACGFNDVSYFTKAFREKNGCTPTAYRK